MGERKYDQMLQIRTDGLREWREQIDDYKRYEAIPCAALNKLYKNYKLKPGDSVVDSIRYIRKITSFNFSIPFPYISLNR